MTLNKSSLGLIAISAFIALYVLLSITFLTQPAFQQHLLTYTPQSTVSILILLCTLCVLSCIGLPRQVVAFTCGYFFGVTLGVLYATLTVTIAAFFTFKLASLLQYSAIAKKYDKQLRKLHNFLAENTFSKALIIRLLPVGSNFLTNILAGIAKVPITPYLCGSCLGFIPQMVIFSLAGAGIKLAESTHIITAAVLFLIATLLGWRLYKTRKGELA